MLREGVAQPHCIHVYSLFILVDFGIHKYRLLSYVIANRCGGNPGMSYPLVFYL